MSLGTFATAINCMDGRVQEPVRSWMREKYGVDFVDMITEPGADKFVWEQKGSALAWLKKKVEISVHTHGSRVIAIVGHHDCAGNQVSEEEHHTHIRTSMKVIVSWGFTVEVIGLWVNERWEVLLLH